MNRRIVFGVLVGFFTVIACQKTVLGRIASNIDETKIIAFANAERQKHGASPLRRHALLDEVAALRADDMFRFQYFGHVSPSGTDMEFSVEKVKYDYLLVGENLIIGNFKDENEAIQDWLLSKSHRKAMLDARYQETGVVAKQGMHQGKDRWLIVQIFGTPCSVCPEIDKAVKRRIDENGVRQNELSKLLSEKSLEAFALAKEGNETAYKEKIQEFQFVREELSVLIEETQKLVGRYNVSVNAFNLCIGSLLMK